MQVATGPRVFLNISVRVRGWCAQPIRDLDSGRDLEVEKMIDDIHAAIGRGCCGSVDAAAWEVRVRHAEGGFEEVGEFGEDVGDICCVCAGICISGFRTKVDGGPTKEGPSEEPTHEYDQSLSSPYHFS